MSSSFFFFPCVLHTSFPFACVYIYLSRRVPRWRGAAPLHRSPRIHLHTTPREALFGRLQVTKTRLGRGAERPPSRPGTHNTNNKTTGHFKRLLWSPFDFPSLSCLPPFFHLTPIFTFFLTFLSFLPSSSSSPHIPFIFLPSFPSTSPPPSFPPCLHSFPLSHFIFFYLPFLTSFFPSPPIYLPLPPLSFPLPLLYFLSSSFCPSLILSLISHSSSSCLPLVILILSSHYFLLPSPYFLLSSPYFLLPSHSFISVFFHHLLILFSPSPHFPLQPLLQKPFTLLSF